MHQNDPIARMEAMTKTQDSKREAARAENQRRFPELAAIVENLRKTGDVKMIWAINTQGDCIGQVPDEIRANIFHGVKS